MRAEACDIVSSQEASVSISGIPFSVAERIDDRRNFTDDYRVRIDNWLRLAYINVDESYLQKNNDINKVHYPLGWLANTAIYSSLVYIVSKFIKDLKNA